MPLTPQYRLLSKILQSVAENNGETGHFESRSNLA
ncbi:hypothetical protein LMG27177_01959 [Paraburkholderia fynbosensis]|uniref:Uncharacterized protein n=1 Tax=Paraburkholderia fynbosensis TaxID=1200993 RepID=A0A6J5FSM1_9BURK|nr:hypothetical protein LMG27177_01959 [Paraburkholderia fynbosensis]